MRTMQRGVLAALMIGFAVGAAAQESSGAVRIAPQSFSAQANAFPSFFPTYDALADPRTGESAATAGLVERARIIPVTLDADTDYAALNRNVRALAVYTLREDLTWRDGTPITAFDAQWSLSQFGAAAVASDVLTPINQQLHTVFPYDARTLVALVTTPDCNAAEVLPNFTVYPVEVNYPGYSQQVAALFAGVDLQDVMALDAALLQFHLLPQVLRYVDMNTLYARSPIADMIIDGDVTQTRLLFGENETPVAVMPTGDALASFQSRQTDVIINPPLIMRDSLRGLATVQIVEPVGRTWYALGFNFGDPADPQPAFDPETGEAIDQGINPYFGDARVREAIALALDLPPIAEAATSGHYALMHESDVPWLPAAQGDPAPYDAFAAGQLLAEAGWIDWTGDGVRECHGCSTADEWTTLRFTIYYQSSDEVAAIAARVLVEQLRRIGVDTSGEGVGDALTSQLSGQTFGAYLGVFREEDPVRFDRSDLYRQTEDRADGLNFMSYHNPDVEAAYDRAEAVCDDLSARRDALNAAEALVLADRAIVPLFAVRDFYAAHNSAVGFDPRGRDPFWNIETWRLDR